MSGNRSTVLSGLLILALFGCEAASPGTDDGPTHLARAQIVTDLHAADSAFQRAIADRDVDRIMALYSDDAVLLPAASPSLAGRLAIRGEWVKLFAIPAFNNTSTLDVVEVAASGDIGYTRGTYSTVLTGHQGERLVERGKWVSVWKRQPDGSWRVVVDIYNTDTPPPDHI